MTFQPYPWQQEDAEQLAASRRWILANEMRTGKTGAAIVGARLAGAKVIGVVCPAIVTREWRKQLEDFETRTNVTWRVESYDRVSRGKRDPADLLGHDLDCLILDECHYLKSPEAKRTTAIYGDGHARKGMLWVPRIWGLSGTPAPNHAGEYYTHLRAFGLTSLRYWPFLERYCIIDQTMYGWRVIGNRKETLPELRAMLGKVMSRRLQRDVWKETPEPFWSVRTMTPTREDAKRLQELDQRMNIARDNGADRGETSRQRRELGLLKVPYATAHILDLLNAAQVPKVLVGVWHEDVLDALRSALRAFNPIVIAGPTPDKQRWELKERFQTAPACRVAIVQMKTGGTGISLSSAAHVVIAEPDWARDVNEQFVQRPQHIARTVPLPVDLIALDGSLDEAILRSNLRKQRINQEITLDAPASGSMAEPSLDDLLGVNDAPIFLDDL